MPGFFDTSVEYLKGVGPQRSLLLNKELEIFSYGDLIQHYPFRYEDRTRFYNIGELHEELPNIQIKGQIRHLELVGRPRRKRLVAYLFDDTGEIELVWFKGAQWISKRIKPGETYVVFGKPRRYGRRLNIAHPEFEPAATAIKESSYLQPVYSSTEKLKNSFLDSKAIAKLIRVLLGQVGGKIKETLSAEIIGEFKLIDKPAAIENIHFPKDSSVLQKARFRLKFEELFFIQLRLLKLRQTRIDKYPGQKFESAALITEFYNDHLPFELTGAQKRVIREIYRDMKSGRQMNRLLQGDVGSGKTIVAFLSMLQVVSSGAQAAMMAPTEILAQQHYNGLKPFAEKVNLRIALLTGSTKQSERKIIHTMLRSGDLHMIVGTHALLEDVVQFQNLGLAIIDEQHRFGVAQRSRLWGKNQDIYPHVLVMTATPIPRTLAMSLYGDLDISTIDELPKGRRPIKTVHRWDSNRLKVFGFLRDEINKGRQVYIVYPLIEESEKMDLKDLMDGYESIIRAFPEFQVSILHGKMKSDAKDYEMQRFVKGETQIMVATTVIEVGVDVPNATVMVVENAERFGLAQLHQLRGRVGRGAEQSYCVLMTKYALSEDGKVRIETLVRTNNGFEIADVDLSLRGPGDLAGTQQSGVLDLLIADLSQDSKILQAARGAAVSLMENDPDLATPENRNIREQVDAQSRNTVNWSRIS